MSLALAGTCYPLAYAVSIADLPAELLLIIFKYLYMESRVSLSSLYQLLLEERGEDSEESDDDSVEAGEDSGVDEEDTEEARKDTMPVVTFLNHTVWSPWDDVLSPALFPSAPASVCKLWRNVMSSFPPFWTRVVIFADAVNPSLSFPCSQLEWSRDLPLDVTVATRKPDAFLGSPDTEQTRLRQIIDMLAPHVWRCLSLHYEVTYTSSLPRIAVDFPCTAPQLWRLKMKASAPNGLPGFCDRPGHAQFPFPSMLHLEVDGWNFVELIRNSKESWFRLLVETEEDAYRTLTVSHYRPLERNGKKDQFFIHDAFPILNESGTLSLENLDFDYTLSGSGHFHYGYEGSLSLCSLSVGLTAAILWRRDVEYLTITQCSLKRVPSLPARALTLRDIHDDDLAQTLCELLPDWEGRELNIDNCHEFDDTVLEMLAEITTDQCNDLSYVNASMLSSLTLEACHGFSIPALRRMTETRRAWAVAPPADVFCRLEYFAVDVRGVSSLREEERRWFGCRSNDAGSYPD